MCIRDRACAGLFGCTGQGREPGCTGGHGQVHRVEMYKDKYMYAYFNMAYAEFEQIPPVTNPLVPICPCCKGRLCLPWRRCLWWLR